MEDNLKFTAISTDDSLAKSLGITPEREEEITNALNIGTLTINKRPVSTFLSKASEICKTHQELAYLSFKIGAYIQKISNDGTIDLLNVLGQLKEKEANS